MEFFACTDVSDLKEAQIKLRQNERELEQVAKISLANSISASIAHELNQPLQTISNYTYIVHGALKSDSFDKEVAIDYLQKACDQALRAGKVIASLRSLYGRRAFNPTLTSMPVLNADSLRNLHAEIEQCRVNVVGRYAPNLPHVMVDSVLFQQVILNVLDNAIDSMRHTTDKDRELVIDLHCMNGNLNILIQDSGEGLSPEMLSKIQEPFFTTKSDGLGLGLTVARRIAEMHGVFLTFGSKPGVGTTVSFQLKIP